MAPDSFLRIITFGIGYTFNISFKSGMTGNEALLLVIPSARISHQDDEPSLDL
jgi:hypothetical protein